MADTLVRGYPDRKLKVVRVVTASYVVAWHLHNTLKRLPSDFEVYVAGQDVSRYASEYPDVRFVDIDIERKTRLLADLSALISLVRLFSACRPDIVHSIMPKAGLLAALAAFFCRVPVRIHTFTGQVWSTRRGIQRHFLYWLDRLLNALNSSCMTDGPMQSEYLYRHGVKTKAGEALPLLGKGSLSGIDLEKFNRERLAGEAELLRKELGIGPDDFIFAYIARKSVEKGALDILHVFMEVSAEFPDAKLLFVGQDESGGRLDELMHNNTAASKQVISRDRVTNHEVYLALSDVLCLPSYREGLSTIVLDAAAMGVPTIGSNIPGVIDVLEDGVTGRLFEAGDRARLAELLREAMRNKAQFREMGRIAQVQIMENFSAEKLYAELKAFYMAQWKAQRQEG